MLAKKRKLDTSFALRSSRASNSATLSRASSSDLSEASGLAAAAGPWQGEGGWRPSSASCPFLQGRFSAKLLTYANNPRVFTAGLVTSSSPCSPVVRVGTTELLSVSQWFEGVVRQRDVMNGGPLDRVLVPCDVPHSTLQAVVTGMYKGRITVRATSLRPLLLLADAMLLPELTSTCTNWAMQTLQHPSLTPQWALHVYATAKLLQLTELDAQVTRALMQRCTNSAAQSHKEDLQALAAVLAEKSAMPVGLLPLQAEKLVEELRSAFHTRYGPNCPEVFLLVLLVELAQQGLRIAPLVACINEKGLHQLDIKALVDCRLKCGNLEDDYALQQMLLKAAVRTTLGRSCLHVAANLKLPTSSFHGLDLCTLDSPTVGTCTILTQKDFSGRTGLYIRPPMYRLVKDAGAKCYFYAISGSGLQLQTVRLQVDTMPTMAGVGQGLRDALSLLPGGTGIFGAFLQPR